MLCVLLTYSGGQLCKRPCISTPAPTTSPATKQTTITTAETTVSPTTTGTTVVPTSSSNCDKIIVPTKYSLISEI